LDGQRKKAFIEINTASEDKEKDQHTDLEELVRLTVSYLFEKDDI